MVTTILEDDGQVIQQHAQSTQSSWHQRVPTGISSSSSSSVPAGQSIGGALNGLGWLGDAGSLKEMGIPNADEAALRHNATLRMLEQLPGDTTVSNEHPSATPIVDRTTDAVNDADSDISEEHPVAETGLYAEQDKAATEAAHIAKMAKEAADIAVSALPALTDKPEHEEPAEEDI